MPVLKLKNSGDCQNRAKLTKFLYNFVNLNDKAFFAGALPDRITGDLFISVLAYHLVHSIRYQLKQVGSYSSWDSIRKQLHGQSRLTVSMQQSNGDMIHIRKSTKTEQRQQKIYDALARLSHFANFVVPFRHPTTP